MKLYRDIPWFNPREMDDETILALSSGQKELLLAFFDSVRIRQAHSATGKHWLVTGPRGGGKSFFLREVQARLHQTLNQKVKLALLPEELINIFSPHEWLNAVSHAFDMKQGDTGSSSVWSSKTTDKAWNKSLKDLLDVCDADLLIIAVENFDHLLKQAFKNDVDSSRLRNLLENEPRIMLLATAVDSSFDENYNKRLFCQFEHHQIQPWKPASHREYLFKRAKLEGKKPDLSQLARIDAYSRYTGGNARVASVLASLILEKQDPLLASADLAATLDKMTDYYRAQLERIPARTRKLFDALLRGGEPCSQSELAERVGARQSDISRAFIWLVDFNYIVGFREKGEKVIRYQVADRLFSQFYRMRYLQPGQNTQLSLLADLLADTIEFSDKWRYAERYLEDGHEREARTMAELGLKERNIDLKDISEKYQSTRSLVSLGQDWKLRDNLPKLPDLLKHSEKHYPTDAVLAEAIKNARTLASATSRFGADLPGAQLVKLTDTSFSLNPWEKYSVYCAMVKDDFSQFQWAELIKTFEEEQQKFQELAVDHPDDIDKLKILLDLGNKYPLAVSFADFSTIHSSAYFEKISRLERLSFQIQCAVKVTALWYSHKHWQDAEKSLSACLTIASTLKNEFYCLDQILRFLSPLQTYSESKIDKNATISYWIGDILLGLGRVDEAIESFFKARNIALKNDSPKHAIFCLERIAWCQAVVRDYVQSISTHEKVINEKIIQGNADNIAWSLGQIARCRVTTEGMDAAWLFLDEQKTPEEEARINSVQQLADAIFDCVQQNGEVAAFSLGCQLFSYLNKRPQYPAEATLRALWIDMVDMRVPFNVLRDLAPEAQHILDGSLSALVDVLVSWLDDLELSPKERIKYRKTLNPDLAATLEALGENLSPGTKASLQLLQVEK
ncbi:hypothetical protein JYT48_02065 [Mariprofundus ferrooxydans]|nr:hypothetical protein [Mariprofundus ferrooxydans]